ncbi:hypothetical protein AB0D27_42480 [Streptomyces sp. NPDC048415]|uniref:hypothetical protein n=1 Tax=Streptomyces sp. NPDC048415 TaxID=3154822 RepID=UPI0034361F1A
MSPRHFTEGFDSADAINNFIAHVNDNRRTTGLDEIPRGKVNPHQFRRPMAMLTRDFPGSEIAVGMQLKHAAARALENRTTQGYMDQAPSWARHLDQAIADRRFLRLRELFESTPSASKTRSSPKATVAHSSTAAAPHAAATASSPQNTYRSGRPSTPP